VLLPPSTSFFKLFKIEKKITLLTSRSHVPAAACGCRDHRAAFPALPQARGSAPQRASRCATASASTSAIRPATARHKQQNRKHVNITIAASLHVQRRDPRVGHVLCSIAIAASHDFLQRQHPRVGHVLRSMVAAAV
jgi:hypothetical protein